MIYFAIVFCVILTVVFPLIALPLNFVGVIVAKSKMRKFFAFLLAFSLAILAYIWIPDSTMDLYRHHQQLGLFTDFDFSQMGVLIRANLEPLQYLIKFFVSQTGNYNLLQFLIVLCGYFELFWIVCDYCQIKNARRSTFLLVLLFAFSGVRFIDFASGLWCNFAIINIAMGVYLEYFRNTKWIQYIFYLVAACLHTGTVYVVVLTILLSKFRLFKKQRLSTLLLCFLVILSIGGIVAFMNNLLGTESTIVSMFNRMYDSYFVNGEQYNELHSGWSLAFAIGNMLLSFVLSIWHYRKNKMNDTYSSLVMYLSVCIFATTLIAGVFMRYGFLLVILSVPLMVDYLIMMKSKRLRIAFISIIMILVVAQLSRSFAQMESAGLTRQISTSVTSSIIIGG